MIITKIGAGIGNKLFMYAAGRRLAHKHNTELKLDILPALRNKLHPYGLDQLNITATVATPEEIERLKKFSIDNAIGFENAEKKFMPEVLDYPDNIYLHGYWINEKYFADIADIIRREFTLKNPLSAAAQMWQQKILAAECAVSLHFRHGDYAYNPKRNMAWAAVLPLDYYYTCMDILKQRYKNLTAFVFSNNLQWVKENLRLDVPTEFICGGGLTDVEELHLMSLCKHNIRANSTFSWWGAWLNRNPDKKIFSPKAANAEFVQQYLRWLAVNKELLLKSSTWIDVPFDFNKQPDITQRPIFSLLLVVNNDIATLRETLGTILSQNYKFFEVIIIDNASFDGSNALCQQAAKNSDKVTLIKLWDKISNGAAWNMALNIAQGNYAMFLKGNDRLVVNALTNFYLSNEYIVADVVNSAVWLREDSKGNIAMASRKFVAEGDASFRNLREKIRRRFSKSEVLKIFSANERPVPLATKIFNRKFLTDNALRFDEEIADADAELVFTAEAMMRADEMLILPNVFYVAPKI